MGLVLTLCWGAFVKTEANARLSLSAGEVSDGKFTLSVTIPGASWNTFNFDIRYDHTVVQAGDATTTAGLMLMPNASLGNTTGTYKVSGLSVMSVVTTDTVLTIPFTVIDSSAASVSISLAVTDFAANGTQLEYTLPSALSVTLKQAPVTPPSSDDPTPPVSSDTNTPNPPASTDTPTPPPSSDSNTPTDTPTPPPSSDSNTPSDNPKPPASSGNTGDSQTSQDPSIKTDTDTGTQPDGSDSDTPVDSQGSDTVGSTDTSDPSGTSDFSGSSNASSSSQNRPAGSSSDAGKDSTGISSLTLGLIAGGISILFCAVLTVLALLRRRK